MREKGYVKDWSSYISDNNDETEEQFGEIMQNMFNGTDALKNFASLCKK